MLQKCDILYIHSGRNPTNGEKIDYGIVPMGIIAILNALRGRGYRVLGINMVVESSLDPDFSLSALLEETEYQVLLTDVHWYEHSFGAMYVAARSKNMYPQIPVVIGGYTATIYGEEILDRFPSVDFAVTGDSDLPLPMLVDYLLGRSDVALRDIPNLIYRDGTKVLVGEKKWHQTTLDELDLVPIDFFRHAEYIPYLSASGLKLKKAPKRWLCIARGCLYNCAYCCGARENMQTLFGRCNVLKRSAETVAADFVAIDLQGCRIAPSHDLQMFGQSYYAEIFRRIRESGQRPAMYLELFQLPTKEFVDEVASTFHCSKTVLEISPISGNEQLRKENGKLFSNEQLYETVSYILSKGIRIQMYYTVNIPGETREQLEDTLFQMKYLRMAFGIRNIFYQRVVIDPLAPMRQWEGVRVEYNSFMDYYRYCQIPNTEKLKATGFCDNGAVPLEEKMQMYISQGFSL